MIKYLIKVGDGWVSDPLLWEDGVPGITNDVFKAWIFDKRVASDGEIAEAFGRAWDRKILFGIDYEAMEFTGADDLMKWLGDEEVLEGQVMPETFEYLNGEIYGHISTWQTDTMAFRKEVYKDGTAMSTANVINNLAAAT